jgi:hypothetical protein
MSFHAGNIFSKGVRLRLAKQFLFIAMSAFLFVPMARAGSSKVALVIANGGYGSGATTGCGELGRDVATALHADGFHVEQAIDGSSVIIQSAILSFARQLKDERTTAVAYVCSHVASREKRLFLLPVGVDLKEPSRLQTQGVVVKAVLNALDNTDGVLLGDLGTTDVPDAQESLDALVAAQNVQMALSARPDFSGNIGKKLIAQLAQPASSRISVSKFLLGIKEKSGEATIVVALPEEKSEPVFFGPELPSKVAAVPLPKARPNQIQQSGPTVKAKAGGARKKLSKRPTARRKVSEKPGFLSIFGADRRKKK